MLEGVGDALGRAATWTTVVVLASLALYWLWRLHPRYGGNPGLPSFPILGSLPLIFLNRHRFYEWSCEIFENAQALSIYSFMGSETTIATADPQNVHHILKSRFDIYIKGPNFYPFFIDLLGRGIFNCDGPLWRFQRKVASNIFTSNSLKSFVVNVADAEISSRLLPILDFSCDYKCGFPVDLQAIFMDFSFDTISQLALGADLRRLASCKFIKSEVNGTLQYKEVRIAANRSNCPDRNYQIPSSRSSLQENDGCVYHASPREIGFACLDVPDDLIEGFANGFQLCLQIIANRFLTPKFVWQTKRWLNIGSEKKLHDAMNAVTKFTSFVIEKSKSESRDGRQDLLARFIQLSKAEVASLLEAEDEEIWKANCDEPGQALSDSLLTDILLSFLLAGRDAVASGITFLIWQLCLHPVVEENVYGEIKRIVEERPTKQHMNSFSYEELRRMQYLHAALSESMRLFPPVPSDPKYAAQADILPCGKKVQKGNVVSYNVFAMGRARQVWGDDCREFKPERWLDGDGAFVPVSPFRYPVFQAGPRTCLGKDFAYIQIKLVVACLVHNYKISVSPEFKPKLSFSVNLSLVNGLPVSVRRR